jgi:hypothetical protein
VTNILSVTEGDRLLKITHPHQTVSALEDMYQRLVPTHLKNKTSQDGPCLKLAELEKREDAQTEIKLTTLDPLSEDKLIQRIELDKNAISDQVTVDKLINLEHSRTKCKEGVA